MRLSDGLALAVLLVLTVPRHSIARGSPMAAECHLIRGRLAVWNGTPSVRIWPVGTRRELGVADAHGDTAGERLFPAEVAALIEPAPDRTVVFGDYRVCPLSPRRPGRMQMVYIAGASRLRAAPR
jgi:hypothetical protein